MKSFKNTHEAETLVIFHEEEKAIKFFMGTDFSSAFWQFDALNEVSRDIAHSFMNAEDRWDNNLGTLTRFLEAYGKFAYNPKGYYELVGLALEYSGLITIKIIDELEVHYTEEV